MNLYNLYTTISINYEYIQIELIPVVDSNVWLRHLRHTLNAAVAVTHGLAPSIPSLQPLRLRPSAASCLGIWSPFDISAGWLVSTMHATNNIYNHFSWDCH